VDAGWLPIVIDFVLTLTLVLLTLAFRSIVIPLTAIAVNLLSVGAAYGILVLVFQEGVGADLLGLGQVQSIEAWVPVFLFSVLFGLSMDYQVFLLSRIHERWRKTGDTNGAIVYGVSSTARLITGAAGDHHRCLRRLCHRSARLLPGDGLWHRRRARARRHAGASGAHSGCHATAGRAQLVSAALAAVDPRHPSRGIPGTGRPEERPAAT
jgi:hypothetical protein